MSFAITLQVTGSRTEDSDNEVTQRMLFSRRNAAISLQARRTVDPAGEEAETGTVAGEVESTTGLDFADERVLHLLKRKSYLLYRLQKMKCKQAKEHNARKGSHVSLTALARYCSRPELRASNLQLVPRPPCAGESSGGATGLTAYAGAASCEGSREGSVPSSVHDGSRAGQTLANRDSQKTLDDDDDDR